MTKKKETPPPSGNSTEPTPATGKGSRPRKAKVTQPAWYRADIGDTFRLIEEDSPEAVSAKIVTVRTATPHDFVKAGEQGISLESKNLGGSVAD